MSIFSKLIFWRKKEQEEMNEEFQEQNDDMEYDERQNEIPSWNKNYDETGMRKREKNFQQDFRQDWQQPQQPMQQNYRDVNEIILARLEVINAKLDSLNQRIANLERYASEDKKARW